MNLRKIAIVTTLALLVNGCTYLGARPYGMPRDQTRSSTSLVDFLYPYGGVPPSSNAIPELRLPLRVGLAFLPERPSTTSPVPAAEKEHLLNLIRARFRDRKFVSEIVIIPDYYLKGTRGFAGLQGVQRLYGVDVMALASYDQVTHKDNNKLSLGYLTIVGAYLLPGNTHDTTTLVDLAVVDPATDSLVLRAGGTDTRKGYASYIDQDSKAREAAVHSFSAATGQVINNFDQALNAFEADVRAGKANIRVSQRNGASPGGGGGGSMTWPVLAVLLSFAFLRRWVRSTNLGRKA